MDGPSALVPIALAGFFPVALVCFARLGPRAGMLTSMVGGWLFLPSFDLFGADLPLLHTKAAFVPAVVIAASLLLDGRRWMQLRPRLLDAPMAVWCLIPYAVALANDLGAYEAASAAFEATMTWGAPYLLGRVYLADPGGTRALADAVVKGALVYVPFCLWEIRMSPQLHRVVYGFQTFGFFSQSVRFGGYRPSVFMQDGLMVAMFMASGTLAAFWLWRTGSRRVLGGVPFGLIAGVLAVTTVLCKSVGALALLAAGTAVLEGTRQLRGPALVLVLLATPPLYCAARLAGWTGESLVELSQEVVNTDRAQSLGFRIENEDMLNAKALRQPWLGWGRWGRSRVYDESGRDLSITDGMWIIALGVTGLVGLIAMWLSLAVPSLVFLRRFAARRWSSPGVAPAAALCVVILLWMIDDLLNAMMTPIYPMIAGALAALALAAGTRRRPRLVREAPAPLPAPAWIRSHAS
jgi:hypothetical protein